MPLRKHIEMNHMLDKIIHNLLVSIDIPLKKKYFFKLVVNPAVLSRNLIVYENEFVRLEVHRHVQ
jgi:hypothetical protein